MMKMEGYKKKKGNVSTIGSCVKVVIICQLVVIAFLFASYMPSRNTDIEQQAIQTPPLLFSQTDFEELSNNVIKQNLIALESSNLHENRHLTPNKVGGDLDVNNLRVDRISMESKHNQFHDINMKEQIDPNIIMKRNEVIPPLTNLKKAPVVPAVVHATHSYASNEELSFPLDLSEEHLCRTYPKVCQCEPLSPKVCYSIFILCHSTLLLLLFEYIHIGRVDIIHSSILFFLFVSVVYRLSSITVSRRLVVGQ